MAPPLQTRVDTHHFDGIAYRIRCLIDGNQFDDPDGVTEALGISSASWPFFGMLWPSGLLLADLLSREPLGGGRILELGCGLGMASLVINARGGDILATDYHPRAEVFLHDNSRRNALTDTPFQRLDWRMPNPDLGVFDLIIGSDLLYEPRRASSSSIPSAVCMCVSGSGWKRPDSQAKVMPERRRSGPRSVSRAWCNALTVSVRSGNGLGSLSGPRFQL
jgi:SAM-dependent methyltransferase